MVHTDDVSCPNCTTSNTIISIPRQFQIHRFDFSIQFAEELANFVKKHLYDDRTTFKQSFMEWKEDEEIQKLIQVETQDMVDRGFDGDVLDKMFKSARYYHRRKLELPQQKQDKVLLSPPPASSILTSTRFSPQFLKIIDADILHQVQENLLAENTTVSTLSQATAFNSFCKMHQDSIYQECIVLKQKYDTIPTNIADRIKKTYKNRFYNSRKEMLMTKEKLV